MMHDTDIKYVFWDSDNTLVDTADMHWRKHVETLKEYGITLDDEYRTAIYTNNGQQNWEWITEKLGLHIPANEYLNRIDNWYIDHIDEINIRSGVEETLTLFEQAGLKQAVVSNGRRRSVMAALQTKNIADRMEFIFTKEDYEGRKPGPEPYLAAMQKMAEHTGQTISASECMVIEDDPKGVQSGHSAGMLTIHRKLSENQEATDHAHRTIWHAKDFIGLWDDIIGA